MVFRTRADQIESDTGASDAVKDAVGHMVRQFADPLAFYRELVQNSIDAGATRIDVRLRYDRDIDSVNVSVHDDGCGMNLETVERCLLILFRSSKDKDPTKIGKFGVGFFSIFSLSPSVVRVDTGTGEGAALRVELKPDFSYEVTERSEMKGTTVALSLPMKLAEARSFAERSLLALERWCPHVEVQLHLLSTIQGGDIDRRIDKPFDLEGDCVVRVQLPGFRAAMRLAPEGKSALYKRGILLYESPQPIVNGVTFKIESSALVHTVSRDNVKRDGGYQRCIEVLERAVNEQLIPTAQQEAVNAMRALVAGAVNKDPALPSLQQRAWRLLHDVLRVRPDWKGLPIPLCDPTANLQDQVLVGSRKEIRWSADVPSEVTRAIAQSNQPVLWTHALGFQNGEELARILAPNASNVETRFTVVIPTELTSYPPETIAMFETARKMMNNVSIPAFRPANIHGFSKSQLFVAISADQLDRCPSGKSILLDASDSQSPLYALLSNRGCALNVQHGLVLSAIKAAKNNYALSALLLARSILLQLGKLDRARDESLFQSYLSVQR